MKISLVKGDITILDVDVIVNAANSSLLGGGGVDGAIHRAAGKELYNECLALNGCNTGEAKITKGYKLKAKYIIHTVGPIYYEYDPIEANRLLSECYISSLNLALKYHLHSIAFPNISTGVYGFPKLEAARVVIKTIKGWLKNHPEEIEIIFICYDDENYHIYQNMLNE